MRTTKTLLASAVLVLLAGCQDSYVNKLLTQDTGSGKVPLSLIGSGEQLIQQKKITAHEVVIAADKTPLDVWVCAAAGPGAAKGTVVLLHGLNESKAAFPYFGTAERLTKMGYDAVLIDLRAHGRSGGKYITFGAKEKLDVKAVMDCLTAKKSVPEPFYVFGANLGAAVAIQYAAIDERVKGVVAIAPYKDYDSIATWQMHFMAPMMSATDVHKQVAQAAKTGGFEPADASALSAAKQLKCPLLLVQGLLDLSVPLEHTQAILEAANGPKKLKIITPGPEEAALLLILEDWIAGQVNDVATGKLDAKAPATPKN